MNSQPLQNHVLILNSTILEAKHSGLYTCIVQRYNMRTEYNVEVRVCKMDIELTKILCNRKRAEVHYKIHSDGNCMCDKVELHYFNPSSSEWEEKLILKRKYIRGTMSFEKEVPDLEWHARKLEYELKISLWSGN